MFFLMMISSILSWLQDIIFPPKCGICGDLSKNVICPECIRIIGPKAVVLKEVCFVTYYEGLIKKAVKRVKFRKKKSLCSGLGEILADNMPAVAFDIIIPVPLHSKRLAERGFNQAEILCEEIAERTGKQLLRNVLIRKKDTKRQFGLKKEERRTNVRSAFMITERAGIEGKNVLLVDDIYTTGATADECRMMLLGSGALKVQVLCLSRAIHL